MPRPLHIITVASVATGVVGYLCAALNDLVGTSFDPTNPNTILGFTLVMMVGEITAGSLFGSMALLADGWHMASHAAALGVAVFAYVYAQRHAETGVYTFGTGKVGDLAAFSSALTPFCTLSDIHCPCPVANI